MTTLNGMSVDQLQGLIETVRADHRAGDRDRRVTASWVGGRRSRVTTARGVTHLGGDEEPNPMQILLGSLGACLADVIATHASLMGIRIDSLEVEASGHFDVLAYFGIDQRHGSGYQEVRCTVRLSAPSATPDQLLALHDHARRSSPVGNTLERQVPITLSFAESERGLVDGG